MMSLGMNGNSGIECRCLGSDSYKDTTPSEYLPANLFLPNKTRKEQNNYMRMSNLPLPSEGEGWGKGGNEYFQTSDSEKGINGKIKFAQGTMNKLARMAFGLMIPSHPRLLPPGEKVN